MSLLETFTCVPVAAATIAIALTVASAVGMALARRAVPFDYRLFRSGGFEVLAGLDPNAVAPSTDRQVALNPSTAWPLFGDFSQT